MSEKFPVKTLYVEDDPVTREMVASMLERTVETLFTASNGEEGLALFKTLDPDLVITDIRMPLKDGLEMSLEIKALNPVTQLIVMSAHSDTEYMLKAIDIGIDRYVLKPIDTKNLFAAIRKSAEIIGMEKTIARQNVEREELIKELQDALSNVKTLRGLLPICASCKKIRDDNGYWSQIESYFSKYSDIMFSHGICPDCAERLYPDIIKK